MCDHKYTYCWEILFRRFQVDETLIFVFPTVDVISRVAWVSGHVFRKFVLAYSKGMLSGWDADFLPLSFFPFFKLFCWFNCHLFIYLFHLKVVWLRLFIEFNSWVWYRCKKTTTKNKIKLTYKRNHWTYWTVYDFGESSKHLSWKANIGYLEFSTYNWL